MVPALLLVAQLATSGAWSSARPPECAPLDFGRANNVWERAKAPELRRYCDLLASGASKLAGDAPMKEQVVAIAERADRTMPNKAAPLVLRGRALALMGRNEDALAALRAAKQRDDRALDDPLALFAWARVLARTGDLAGASDAYHTLLPRAGILPLAERSSASFEAGLLSMARGLEGLDTTIAVLRESVRAAQETAQLASVLALALALDRQGSPDEARALLEERVHGDPRPALGSARGRALFAPALAMEAHALAAIALELRDPNGAREEWQAYLKDAGSGAWAAHARAHLAQGGGRGR